MGYGYEHRAEFLIFYGNHLVKQSSPTPIYDFAPTRLAAQSRSFCRVVDAADAVARLVGSGRRPLSLSKWWTFDKPEVCAWFYFVLFVAAGAAVPACSCRRLYCFKWQSIVLGFLGAPFRKASALFVETIIVTLYCPLRSYEQCFFFHHVYLSEVVSSPHGELRHLRDSV